MAYIDRRHEFYAQAADHEITGEVCADCRHAHHGYTPEDMGHEADGWDAAEYDRNAAAYDMAIHEGDEDDDAPQRFVYRGRCDMCDTMQGGDRWPVILTPRSNT